MVGGGEDIGGMADDGGGVVDGTEFGHAFAATLFALGQAARELVRRALGGLFRGFTQGLGTYHDALAVDREHEQVQRVARLVAALLVEGLDVIRRTRGELFHLAFSHLLAGGPPDGVPRLFEGSP
jgi:hypothetical protein